MHSWRSPLTAVALFALGMTVGVQGQSVSVNGSEYEGAEATGLALRRLGNTARVLHIGAHPDDENTALFAPLELGRGVDAAYLSLTRGEGGQNGIGPELGVALGLIRSEELLAARRLDGGDQFFSRAIDYGYSKNADEAFRHWPHDTLLADVVEIIRQYRPDVIVSAWSGTPRDGHGQHQAAGILAREAFLAAGDPSRFPDQIQAGLRPFSPARYYRSAWFSAGDPDVELNTGELDPLLGASYYQIAMAARSRHRSQDQGRPLDAGPRRTGFDLVEDPAAAVEVAGSRSFGRYGNGPAAETPSLFAGVDTLLSQRARSAGLDRAAELFQEYEALVAQARADYNPLEPWSLLPVLDEARGRLTAAGRVLDEEPSRSGPAGDLAFHLRDETEDLRTALLAAANVALDVVADESNVVPGQTVQLELGVWNGGPEPVSAQVQPLLPPGWGARPVGGAHGRLEIPPGERAAETFEVTVPVDARLTMPYYLDPHAPEPVDLYGWPEDVTVQGLPFAPGPLGGLFSVTLDDHAPVTARREATHVAVDPRSGQYREPVKVVPPVSVAVEPALAVVRVASPEPFPVTVQLRSQAPRSTGGALRLALPEGWTSDPAEVPVAFDGQGTERTVSFEVHPPIGVTTGQFEVEARMEAGGSSYALGYDVVDYPHIAPHHLYHTARVRVRAMDVAVADVRVGYIPGAGDGVPEALDQLGLEWETLGPEDLAAGDFDRFDVVVTGIRAYEVNDDLVAHNQRLLDWVRGGGTLIVQYNKYPALDRDYTPWPVTIARPHGRVTDETAPVRVLEPDHPVFTTPNQIGPADWDGWVQERGLYFWETWDSLTPLLAMSDPGEEELLGSLLIGPLGQGTYVYTALAFFRQLPEGVPGAYRLFANLLSLGAR